MGPYRPDVFERLIPGHDKSSASCVGAGRGVKTTRYGGLGVHVPSTRGCPHPTTTRPSGWRGTTSPNRSVVCAASGSKLFPPGRASSASPSPNRLRLPFLPNVEFAQPRPQTCCQRIRTTTTSRLQGMHLWRLSELPIAFWRRSIIRM